MKCIIAYGNEDDCLYIIDEQGLNITRLRIDYHEDDRIGIKTACAFEEILYAAGAIGDSLYAVDIKHRRLLYRTGAVGRHTVSLKAQGEFLYVCCNDTDTINLVERNSGMPLISSHLGNCLTSIEVMGERCIVSSGESHELKLLDALSLQEIASKQLNIMPVELLFDKENSCIFVCGSDAENLGIVFMLDMQLNVLMQAHTGRQPIQMCLLKDNLLVLCMGDEVIAYHKRNNLKPYAWLKTPSSPTALCMEASKQIGYLLAGKQLCLLDILGKIIIKKIPVPFEGTGILIIE